MLLFFSKQLLFTATKTGLDSLRTVSRQVVHKAAESTGESTGNKITDKIVKPKPVSDENLRDIA